MKIYLSDIKSQKYVITVSMCWIFINGEDRT